MKLFFAAELADQLKALPPNQLSQIDKLLDILYVSPDIYEGVKAALRSGIRAAGFTGKDAYTHIFRVGGHLITAAKPARDDDYLIITSIVKENDRE